VRRGAKKLVLVVIDSLKPEMLDRSCVLGCAPTLRELISRGTYVTDCVSTFPSLTPVASASIATGESPDRHHIPSINWYERGEQRYVEYGSSLAASRAFGIVRSLFDTVYNLNLAHLNRDTETVFESLSDQRLRTACTTYLVYRGRTRHQPASDGIWSLLARLAEFKHPVWGPDELFYADLYASQRTGCRSLLGLPGQRDRHTACVTKHLVANDGFDFLLVSLPDNDTYSHKHGPYAQVASIQAADRALAQMVEPAGGIDAFLDEYGVIVMSDHSQTGVEERINLTEALSDWEILGPSGNISAKSQLAVCPGSRAAMVYFVDPEQRDKRLDALVRSLMAISGLDLVVLKDDGRARVLSSRGELQFAPGTDYVDRRGEGWSLEGTAKVLGLSLQDGQVTSSLYPDPLERLWSALQCPTSGDVLLSAAPGYEFVDWGGADHVGGGGHGSLHRGDSEGVLIYCGVDNFVSSTDDFWSVRDVVGVVKNHFSLR
jgi:predicted AlkP superfamily pyrophosphatase or phosphodiesterase